MSEELTAKEVLEVIGDICEVHKGCRACPLNEIRGGYDNCHLAISKNPKQVIEICKKRKADHAQIETEWVHVCRIIRDTGHKKECVYEEEIDEDEILPFGLYDSIAEKVLKEYCKSRKGNFFSTVERLCRPKEVR